MLLQRFTDFLHRFLVHGANQQEVVGFVNRRRVVIQNGFPNLLRGFFLLGGLVILTPADQGEASQEQRSNEEPWACSPHRIFLSVGLSQSNCSSFECTRSVMGCNEEDDHQGTQVMSGVTAAHASAKRRAA